MKVIQFLWNNNDVRILVGRTLIGGTLQLVCQKYLNLLNEHQDVLETLEV